MDFVFFFLCSQKPHPNLAPKVVVLPPRESRESPALISSGHADLAGSHQLQWLTPHREMEMALPEFSTM